jgi:hypothetical protein
MFFCPNMDGVRSLSDICSYQSNKCTLSCTIMNMIKTSLIYISIIAVLAGYALYLVAAKARQQAHYFDIIKISKRAEAVIERDRTSNFWVIEKGGKDYPCAFNAAIERDAQVIPMFLDTTMKAMTKYLDRDDTDKLSPDYYFACVQANLPNEQQIATFFQNQTRWQDSLRSVVQESKQSLADLDQLLADFPNELAQKILQNGRLDQKAALLQCYALHQQTVGHFVMKALKERMEGDEMRFDRLLPAFSARNTCLRAGDLFECEVFAYPYSTRTENLRMSVNGQTLKIVDGLGQFQYVPKSVGEKKFTVQIDVKNPLTGRVESYRKDFGLEICQ